MTSEPLEVEDTLGACVRTNSDVAAVRWRRFHPRVVLEIEQGEIVNAYMSIDQAERVMENLRVTIEAAKAAAARANAEIAA